MPYTNFPFNIRFANDEVPEAHHDHSVLFFESGDSSFIVVAKSSDVNQLTQLAAGIGNQTGFIWDGQVHTGYEHNLEIYAANTEAMEYFDS